MKCEYGCNKESMFTLKNGKKCCSAKYQSCSALRKRNSESQKIGHLNDNRYKFSKEDRNKSNEEKIKISLDIAFVENSSYSNEFIKPAFIKYYIDKYECNECSLTEWNNKEIILELDHIDGNNRNNLPTNLRLLCPNCHSQTDTFRGRNINNGLVKVSDEDLVDAIKNTINTRNALIKVGLSPKGANYSRVKKLKESFNL